MTELIQPSDERSFLLQKATELLTKLPDSELRTKVAALELLVGGNEKDQRLLRELLQTVPPALHDDFLCYLATGNSSATLDRALSDPDSAVSKAMDIIVSRQAENVLGQEQSGPAQSDSGDVKSLADYGIRGLFIP